MLEIFWNEILLGYSVPGEDRVGPFQGRQKPLGTERMKKTGPTEAVGCIIATARIAKREFRLIRTTDETVIQHHKKAPPHPGLPVIFLHQPLASTFHDA
jgi:hypothetical protein